MRFSSVLRFLVSFFSSGNECSEQLRRNRECIQVSAAPERNELYRGEPQGLDTTVGKERLQSKEWVWALYGFAERAQGASHLGSTRGREQPTSQAELGGLGQALNKLEHPCLSDQEAIGHTRAETENIREAWSHN